MRLHRLFLVTLTTPILFGATDKTVPSARSPRPVPRMPLTFAPNVGQATEATKFFTSTKSFGLSLEKNGLTLSARIPEQRKTDALVDKTKAASAGGTAEPPSSLRYATTSAHLEFMGTNPEAKIEGLDPATAKFNYFLGKDPAKWRSNVPAYARVHYASLYPGVDMLFYGKPDGSLEYDLVVAPGADPNQIRFHVSSAQKTTIDADGNLDLDGKNGKLSLARPMLYQDIDRGKKAVAGAFVQIADNEFAFKTRNYNRTKPLVIDPTFNLLYSTYIGGRHDDQASGMVLDSQNNAYIVGLSASEDFPVSGNAYQPIRSNVGTYTYDVTVSKFSSSGVLLYSTFIGGSNNDDGNAIAVDAAGDAYIAGTTSSTDYPTTANAYSTTAGSGIISELSPDGSTLEYSSYFSGGAGFLALNPQGKLVIAGGAGPGLTTTPGSYKTTLAAGSAAFVAIFDVTKSGTQQLVASTYYGTDSPMANSVGTGNNLIGFTLDAQGNVWIGGQAYTPNLPTTANAYQTSVPAISGGCVGYGAPLNGAAYFAELSADLSKLIYATYFSGQKSGVSVDACSEFTNGLAFDSSGNLFVTGGTASSTFPVTGAVQPSYPGQGGYYGYVGFVAKFKPGVAAPTWSGYFGGNGGDMFFNGTNKLAVDSSGNLWAVGQTQGGSNFPISNNAYQSAFGGGSYDAFISQFSADGTQIPYFTYLGGNGYDQANDIAIDAGNNLYIAGLTQSTNFPVSANALQPVFGEGCPSGCDLNDMFFTILGSGTIGTIGPVVGGNTGDTTITVSGAGFTSSAACQLVQGATTIASVSATVNGGGTSIACTFALSGASTGSYDVVVNNPGGSSLKKTAAFTVQSGGEPNLSVSIVGRPKIRTGTPTTFYVNVANSGNLNAYFVPLWIALPDNLAISVGGPYQQQTTPLLFDASGTAYANTILWMVSPGQTVTVPFQITSSVDTAKITLSASLQPPWFSTAAEIQAAISANTYSPNCITDPGNGYFVNCFGPYLTALAANQIFFSTSAAPMVSQPALSPNTLNPQDNGSGSTCPSPTIQKAGQQAGYNDWKAGKPSTTTPNPYPYNYFGDNTNYNLWQNGYNIGYYQMTPPSNSNVSPLVQLSNSGVILPADSSSPSCSAPPPPPPTLPPPGHNNSSSGSSIDPNYKSGPTGDGSASQYVRGTVPLTYSVGFENEATASLPAAQVVVTDQLDPTKVDLTTVSLGTISFGTNVINLPSGTNNYTTTYTVPGVTSYVVRIQGSLNPATGLLKWTFQTIDPSTGLPPSDPTVGFLPPDTNGIVGQGAVVFNVSPLAGQTTGTQVTNSATVVFDANAPINTPTWLNTLDVNPPVSHVQALPATETPTSGTATFNVSWTGTDVGSGIASYTIYVSDNGGAFTPWQSAVTTTNSSYTGSAGHTYGFYSIATDGAGNVEASKTTAEATTQVPGTLQSQTINFGPITTPQLVIQPLTLSATDSANLPITFTSMTTSVCTVSVGTNTATFLTYGTCTIQASQPGNSTYAPAQSISQSFSVLAVQSITFNTVPTQTVGIPLTLLATDSAGLTIIYTSATTNICNVSGSTVTFSNPGNCTIQANQPGNSNYAEAAQVSQTFSVQAASTPPPSGTTFVTSQSPGPQRNNYTGHVGMQITIGASPISITSLGRFILSGNSATHTVKLVQANGTDVPNGSVSIMTAGATAGTYQYVSLASPVTLLANTSYFLVSMETAGGDYWYDYGAVSGTAVAAVTAPVYTDSLGRYVPVTTLPGKSYVPVSFQYAAPTTTLSVSITSPMASATISGTTSVVVSTTGPVASLQIQVDGVNVGSPASVSVNLGPTYTLPLDTTQFKNGTHSITVVASDAQSDKVTSAPVGVTIGNSEGGSSSFVLGDTPGALRNNYTGFVGFNLSVGSTPVVVTSLGRFVVQGNSGTHLLKLVNGNGTDVPGGSASVLLTGAKAGQFTYATLQSPITLQANTSYYLVSQETAGSDQWHDIGPISTAVVGTVAGPVYTDASGHYVTVGLPGQSYVPVSFLYGTSVNTPSATIISPQNGALISGSNVPVTVSTTGAVTSLQLQVDGVNSGSPVAASPLTLNTTSLTNGQHTLSVVVSDGTVTAVSLGIIVTVDNGAANPTSFITSEKPSTPRNNYTGGVGMEISVGSTALTVTSLGRLYISGNTGTHTLQLVQANGTPVTGGSTSVSMAGGTTGQFVYGPLLAPVTLSANTTYYLVSQETTGGDQWYNLEPVTNTGVAQILGPVYTDGRGNYVTVSGFTGYSYVPLSFQYQ